MNTTFLASIARMATMRTKASRFKAVSEVALTAARCCICVPATCTVGCSGSGCVAGAVVAPDCQPVVRGPTPAASLLSSVALHLDADCSQGGGVTTCHCRSTQSHARTEEALVWSIRWCISLMSCCLAGPPNLGTSSRDFSAIFLRSSFGKSCKMMYEIDPLIRTAMHATKVWDDATPRLDTACGLCGRTQHTRDPRAPCPGVGMNAIIAVKAVRTLHEGCQCSGWCDEIDRQILVFVWNLPLGLNIMNEGGLNGYSAGSRMRP